MNWLFLVLAILNFFMLTSCSNGGCPSGMTKCGKECVSLGSNPEHCGGCGIKCGKFERCIMGRCTFSCSMVDENIPTLMECPIGSKKCYDIMLSNEHCGICDNPCRDTQYCVQGVCVECPEGHKRCDNVSIETRSSENITVQLYIDRSQCVDIMSDKNNCGDCGKYCYGECYNGECFVDGGSMDGGTEDIYRDIIVDSTDQER